MAPRHWRDFDDEPPAEESAAPEVTDPARVSPRLAQLMEERQALETRMQRLSGQTSEHEQRDAPRFPVTPLAERRRADNAWEERRERQRDAIRKRREEVESARREPRFDTTNDARSAPDLPGERLTDGAARLADNADRGSQVLQRLDERVDRGRQRVLRANAEGRQLERRRRKLGEVGVELPDELEQRLGRATQILSTGRKRLEQGSDAWARARDRVREFGDTASMLARRAERILAVSVGSVDELGARTARQRATAAARRKAERETERNDERRRQRALERLWQRRQEEMH
ncbi:hypothetical protein M0534_03330 [Methylonatrum kenyense]|uniref:hypothetical protein n=1 Tax=Methylonatrum kenyense TaxID=455253 RepID=UPI0020C061E9|nr:hypothetical protein [Methylonatrum kenyense]MCK8515368.1 hypothetical protein [Methylonatrum kenyense]